MPADAVAQAPPRIGQPTGIAAHQVQRPVQPAPAAVRVFQRHKQAVIIKPAGAASSKLVKFLLEMSRAAGLEMDPCLFENTQLELNHRPKINTFSRETHVADIARL